MPIFGRRRRSDPSDNPICREQCPEEYIAIETHGFLAEEDSELLALLNRPRPIHGHIEHLGQAGWVGNGTVDIESKIRSLIERGLVVSKTDLIQAMGVSYKDTDGAGEITTLVWPTHNLSLIHI